MTKTAYLAWLRRAALLLLGLCAGCAAPAPEPDGTELAQAIIAGDADADEHPAAVAISIRTALGEEGLCSGVVIAPRVVLTAAHCVAPEAVGEGAELSVFLGSDLLDPAERDDPAYHASVAGVAFDPAFELTTISQGRDVGVVRTTTALPVAPLPFEPSPSLDGVSEVVVVGFGLSSASDPSSAGKRRRGVVPVVDHDDLFSYLGDGNVPCAGDSGGPALVPTADGVERLSGLVSFTNDGCGPGVRVTNLSAYLPFVREQVAKAAEPPAADSDRGAACQLGSGRGDPSRIWPIACLALFGLRRHNGRVARPRSGR